jgi:UDP-glucose 4-epimerase
MISILGSHGFIGNALVKQLKKQGEIVYPYPRKDVKYLFFFGSPSSNILFDQNIDYCFEETINSFLNVIQFCRDNHIKLVYPSSATIYNKNTSYARCKAILEEIHLAYGGDVLALRIFAGYGVGEAHKGEYASVVYQFCQQMKKGERPVIYGDGTQTRDFVYIDDIVDTIISTKDVTGILDVGTGLNSSFNEVVHLINLYLGTDIEPKYVKKPIQYVEETKCSNPIDWKIGIEDGIKRIINE